MDTITIHRKEARDIFSDILVPLSDRLEYVGSKSYILPTYFCRYVGIEGDVDEYNNKLYWLDKKLQNNANGYVRMSSPLNIPVVNIIDKLKDVKTIRELVARAVIESLLPATKRTPLNNLISSAFKDVLELYNSREKNFTKVKNFSIKMLIWLNEWFYKLYTNFDLKESPKVLFYGNIKEHEVYFLVLLSKIGCDVLYINPDKEGDKVFKSLEHDRKYSQLIELKNSMKAGPFPTKEVEIRKPTVAYSVEQEVSSVLYSGESLLFRPRQFEGCDTSPITLKTTYDEFKILWREIAKVRPEFKVEGSKVYIPNLFIKINGVFDDIQKYWADFKYVVNTNNTLLIKEIPFTKQVLSRQEMYSLAFYIKDNKIESERIKESKFYRYKYLKESIQDFILRKTERLMESGIFKNKVDANFKVKILATVLSLDERIVNLIEVFDYTEEIPKLVIYAGNKNLFNEHDLITLAFLNLVGIDIAIFTPTNYNNIELGLKEKYYDVIQLPKVGYNLQVPGNIQKLSGKESLLNKIFKIIGK
ncbi:MAG: tellurium resistance protein [Clostridiaceae bacterium]|nr:tellurium resistance protein [Clostridiaceae bacterium]